MVNKIVDVPDDATNVDIKYVKATVLSDYVVGHQTLSVYKMPDAPEKRVIELPADVIEGIQNAKTYWENVAGFVLNAPSIVFPEIRKSIGEPKASYDKVADILGSWYFGNIEFVAKKEPKFEVVVKIGTVTKKALLSDANYVVFYTNTEHVSSGYQYTFTSEQADKLVAGLTALNARKVKVED